MKNRQDGEIMTTMITPNSNPKPTKTAQGFTLPFDCGKSIDRSLIEIATVEDLDSLKEGNRFYHIIENQQTFLPSSSVAMKYVDRRFYTNPKDPESGDQDYLVATERLVTGTQSNRTSFRNFHWLRVDFLFAYPYSGIFKDTDKMEVFLRHCAGAYDKNPDFHKHVKNQQQNRYDSMSVGSSTGRFPARWRKL